MAQFVNMFEVDLDKRSYPVNLHQTVSEGNVSSNRIGAYVYKDGAAYNLGGNCTGMVMRADGSTVPLTGVIDGNAAYVVLDQPSCAIPGPIQVAVNWVSGNNTTTLLVAYGTVIQTNTRDYVQPGTPIPDINELLAAIEDMEEATAAANQAAEKSIQATKIYSTNAAWIADVPTNKLSDIPVNKVVLIGNTDIIPSDSPISKFIGNVLTICCNHLTLKPGACQIAIGKPGVKVFYRIYIYSSSGNYWSDWHTYYDAAVDGIPVAQYKQYNNRSAWLADFPSDKLADIPVNKIITIGDKDIAPSDQPERFIGNVITITSRTSLQPGACQILINQANGRIWERFYKYSSSGDYWLDWCNIDPGEIEYHVGTGQEYTSFVSLLLDLKGDERKKVIYVHSGEYDIFSEYMAEVQTGRITVPPDDIEAASYFEPYNAFVPNNTKIVGLGQVVFNFKPQSNEISYGASRTWSPLNIYGSVEIENITVSVKNCRYCLHNDDHNQYPDSKQQYKNCRFLYTYSDLDSQNRRLGFNNTIGYGIQNESIHIYEGCEFYIDSPDADRPAFYGHDSNNSKNGNVIVRNSIIHSPRNGNTSLIRLQTLARSQGKVKVLFENCFINGMINLAMNYSDSPQNYEVTLINCNKTDVRRTIASGATIVDPYTVRWFNPLPTPTDQSPQVETNSYSA